MNRSNLSLIPNTSSYANVSSSAQESNRSSASVNRCLVSRNILPLMHERQTAYLNPKYSPQAEDLEFYKNYRDRIIQHEIAIEPFDRHSIKLKVDSWTLLTPNVVLAETGLKSRDIKALIGHISSLTHDPVRCLQYLKPIEESITQKLQERKIKFRERDLPEFIMAGKGHYIPGPPPQGYQPKKKSRILDEVLLEKERAMGLNSEGTPTFVGAIEGDEANPFIRRGYIFKEDVQISTLLLHGKNSHRLFFQALMQSLKGTEFEKISANDLLQLLVTTRVSPRGYAVLWAFLLDSNSDMIEPFRLADLSIQQKNILDYHFYNFSLQSPFVFNSTILCFGKELGLPNLMHCMLDSHWKAASKMADRLSKERMDTSYLTAMEALTLAPLADIGRNYPFTEDSNKVIVGDKYRIYPGAENSVSGIKLKLKQGEELTSEEKKNELFSFLKDPLLAEHIMKDPANQNLILEFVETEAIAWEAFNLFEICVDNDWTHAKELGERLLALGFDKPLNVEERAEFEQALKLFNQNKSHGHN